MISPFAAWPAFWPSQERVSSVTIVAGIGAIGETPRNPPVDGAVETMNQRAVALGDRGVEKVGADGRRRRDPEYEDEDRRHQRAAANAREADERADDETGNGIQRVEGVKRIGKGEHGR